MGAWGDLRRSGTLLAFPNAPAPATSGRTDNRHGEVKRGEGPADLSRAAAGPRAYPRRDPASGDRGVRTRRLLRCTGRQHSGTYPHHEADDLLLLRRQGAVVCCGAGAGVRPVSYTHLRAHETDSYLVCRLLL